MSGASNWGQRAGKRGRVSWTKGAGKRATGTLEKVPEPVVQPAAARFRGSLFPTPLGRKVYSEAAAPHGGSCVHPALPPRSQRPAPIQQCWGPTGGRCPVELGCRTQPPPSASARSRPEPAWRSARAALASGARRQNSLAARPQPRTTNLPIYQALDSKSQTSLTLPENSVLPVGACGSLGERAGARECAPWVRYMPLSSAGGES
nr:uncharacterized protein LOC107974569 [Pan troglodytes]